MRTRALLCAAALAAGAVSSMAQNVYSLNVVGYVNTTFATGFNLVNNPLNDGTNKLSSIMKGANVPDNTQVFVWNPAIQDFQSSTPTYVQASQTWVPDQLVTPGMGVFVYAPGPFTNTFVGNVEQGSLTNPIVTAFNGIASPVPIGGDVSLVLTNMPALDNDQAFKWNTAAQDFTTSSTYVQASHAWVPALNFGVGEGVFYYYNGTSANWIRNFTVQ